MTNPAAKLAEEIGVQVFKALIQEAVHALSDRRIGDDEIEKAKRLTADLVARRLERETADRIMGAGT